MDRQKRESIKTYQAFDKRS